MDVQACTYRMSRTSTILIVLRFAGDGKTFRWLNLREAASERPSSADQLRLDAGPDTDIGARN